MVNFKAYKNIKKVERNLNLKHYEVLMEKKENGLHIKIHDLINFVKNQV